MVQRCDFGDIACAVQGLAFGKIIGKTIARDSISISISAGSDLNLVLAHNP